jgi:hypothetical protein
MFKAVEMDTHGVIDYTGKMIRPKRGRVVSDLSRNMFDISNGVTFKTTC